MSLESILEKAYKAVTVLNQDQIASVNWLLAQQTTDGIDLEKVPTPSITVEARVNQESVPSTGVFEVELVISVTDAVVRKDGIALRLDEIFRYATRPLLYLPLAQMMTDAGAGEENFKCFGLPERGENNAEQFLPGRVTRSKSALFFCSTEIGEVIYPTDPDAAAYFAAADITDETEKTAWNTAVVLAKQQGLWTKMSGLYPWLGSAEESCSFNAKDLSQITWAGDGVFDAMGVTGTATLQGNTGIFVDETTPNSLSFGLFMRTNVDGLGREIYANLSPTAVGIFPDFGGTAFFDNYEVSARLTATTQGSAGFFISSRTAANACAAYIDGVQVATTSNAQGTPIHTEFLIYNTTFSSTRNCGFAFIGEGLTALEVISLNAIVNQFLLGVGRGIINLSCIGDSNTSGLGLSAGQSFPSQIVADTEGNTIAVQNEGIGGQTLLEMQARVATQIAANVKPGWLLNAVHIWGGSNDIFFGASAETTYGRLVALSRTARNLGAKVSVATLLPRNEPGITPNYEPYRLTYNEMVRVGWPTFADGFYDPAADSRIGPASSVSDTTYYQSDETHLTALSQATIIAPSVAAVVRSYRNNSLPTSIQ